MRHGRCGAPEGTRGWARSQSWLGSEDLLWRRRFPGRSGSSQLSTRGCSILVHLPTRHRHWQVRHNQPPSCPLCKGQLTEAEVAESGPAKEMADESDDEDSEDQVRGYQPGCRGVHEMRLSTS
jgi:hypothetical protein